jgi:histidyl-tRNA synthetase
MEKPKTGEFPTFQGNLAIQRQFLKQLFIKTFFEAGFSPYEPKTLFPESILTYKGYAPLNQALFVGLFKNHTFILRPEITYPAILDFVKPAHIYYIDKCFRYERAQFLRHREFTQLGIEILCNKKEISPRKIQYSFFLLTNFLNQVLKEPKYVIEIITPALLNSGPETHEIILQKEKEIYFPPNLFSQVVYAPSSVRGLNYYQDFTFEIAEYKEGKRIQIIGGGKYKEKNIFGYGFGIGLERLTYCRNPDLLKERIRIYVKEELENFFYIDFAPKLIIPFEVILVKHRLQERKDKTEFLSTFTGIYLDNKQYIKIFNFETGRYTEWNLNEL